MMMIAYMMLFAHCALADMRVMHRLLQAMGEPQVNERDFTTNHSEEVKGTFEVCFKKGDSKFVAPDLLGEYTVTAQANTADKRRTYTNIESKKGHCRGACTNHNAGWGMTIFPRNIDPNSKRPDGPYCECGSKWNIINPHSGKARRTHDGKCSVCSETFNSVDWLSATIKNQEDIKGVMHWVMRGPDGRRHFYADYGQGKDGAIYPPRSGWKVYNHDSDDSIDDAEHRGNEFAAQNLCLKGRVSEPKVSDQVRPPSSSSSSSSSPSSYPSSESDSPSESASSEASSNGWFGWIRNKF